MRISRKAGIFLSTAVCLDVCLSGGTVTLAAFGISSVLESIAKMAPSVFSGLATTYLTQDSDSGFDQQLDKVLQQSINQTFAAVKEEFLGQEEFLLPWWRSLVVQYGFDIPDHSEAFLIRQSLEQNFFEPLYTTLTDDKVIEEFISQNSELSAEEVLKKILSNKQIEVPGYLERHRAGLNQAVVDTFKSKFLSHFIENLLQNEPARKYYQNLLLQSTFKLLQKQGGDISTLLELSQYHQIKLEGIEESILESFREQSQKVDKLREDFHTQFGLVLDIHKTRLEDERDQFSFVSLFTHFQGRTLELDILFNFLNDERKFLFYALSGSGGSGKSRLANELCLRAESIHWIAGFSNKDNSSDFRWKSFRPIANTLIVLDYVRGRKEEVVQILKALSSHTDNNLFKHKVRILLLERDYDEELTRDIFSVHTRRFYYSYQINKEEKALLLSPMDSDTRWAIIKQIVSADPARYEILLPQRAKIIEALDRQDPGKRPLFTFFSAVALLEGNDITHWNTNDNLTYQLDRLETKIWSQIPLWQNEKLRTQIKHLIWLGAICEYLERGDFETIQSSEAFAHISEEWGSEEFWKQLSQLFNLDRSEGSSADFPGIKPDLLAEHFIVTHISKCASIPLIKNILVSLFQCAWRIRPDRVWWMSYLTLSNYLNQDNQGVSEYLQWLEGEEELLLTNGWAIMLFNNIGTLLIEKDTIESKKWFLKASELGDPNAMANLANSLLTVEPKKATELYRKAAKIGHVGSINTLAFLLQNDQPEEAIAWYRIAAELGEPDAMFGLANMLLIDDPSQAMDWHKKAAELGHIGSMNNLGYLLQNDYPDEAKIWFRNAAELGESTAMDNLALLLQKDNPTEAESWLRKAAELGDASAMNNFALLLEKDEPESALDWFRKSAELGDANAMYNLARRLESLGETEQVLDWYNKAAEHGVDSAMNDLAFLLEKEHPELAMDWYKKAVDFGESRAMVNLGNLLIDDDPIQALDLYKKAADLGNVGAMNNLAFLAEKENRDLAMDWYRKAIDLGDSRAMNSLALMLQTDESKEAEELFRKAAGLENSDAMANLGFMMHKEHPEQAIDWYKKAISLGHSGAMNNLAHLIKNIDPEQAFTLFQQAAELGEPNAMLEVASSLEEDNREQAIEWYKKAAELGHTNSMHNLALLLVKDHPEQAKEWYKRASELGNVSSMNNLAVLLQSEDSKQALEWSRKAAELGNVEAMVTLANLLKTDDFEQAESWYAKAAELGSTDAMFNQAFMLLEKNMENALILFKKAANLGQVDAMVKLAIMLEKDQPEQAIFWYKKAAELEHTGAMNNLAFILQKENPKEAMEWCKKAADLGQIEAMVNLANSLVKKDMKQAMGWYTKAAELGHAEAMVILANLLREEDIKTAIDWYRKAADLGHADAKFEVAIYLWEHNLNPEEAWRLVNSLVEHPDKLGQEIYDRAIWLWIVISAWVARPIYEKERHSVFDLLARNSARATENLWALLYHDYSDFLFYEFENGVHAEFLKKKFPIFYLVILHFHNPSSALLENIAAEYQEEFTQKINLIEEKRKFYAQ
jgi:TPR repeat protein